MLSEALSELGQLCLHGPILSSLCFQNNLCFIYIVPLCRYLFVLVCGCAGICISLWIDLPIVIVDVDVYGYSCSRLVLLLRLSSFFLSLESLSML